MWNIVGLSLAIVLTGIALWRSRVRGGFYDAGVYGMLPGTHRRYAAVSLAFAFFFATELALRTDFGVIVALAIFVAIALLYLTSFLRGYADDDE